MQHGLPRERWIAFPTWQRLMSQGVDVIVAQGRPAVVAA
jgi:hypothetical protein